MEKETWYPLNRRKSGLQIRSGCFEEDKNLEFIQNLFLIPLRCTRVPQELPYASRFTEINFLKSNNS
jgi:hypothetical protein